MSVLTKDNLSVATQLFFPLSNRVALCSEVEGTQKTKQKNGKLFLACIYSYITLADNAFIVKLVIEPSKLMAV